jgi:hypothetical protein
MPLRRAENRLSVHFPSGLPAFSQAANSVPLRSLLFIALCSRFMQVHGPPGGASSISFAWDEPETRAPVRRGAPAPTSEPPMTTAGMYGSGYGAPDSGRRDPYGAPSYAPPRSTAAPYGTDLGVPGPMAAPISGRSLGGGPSHDDDMYRTSSGAYGGGAGRGTGSVPSPYTARSGSSYASAPSSGVNDILTGGGPALSSNAFANGANQNAGNVLTDRRTTRVLAAPGGKSSITFG